MERVTISVEETCKALGLGHTKVKQLIRNGDLASVKLGGRRLVKVESIHALLAAA